MNYLLDTDSCIYIINKKSPKIINKLKSKNPNQIYISSITISELFYGIEKSSFAEKNRNALENFLIPFEKISYNIEHAKKYGEIRSKLEKKGEIIGPYDLMICAIAKYENMILVSNNIKEFRRVKGIKIESWI